MAYQGLRDFVSALEQAGELKRVFEPVSAELEITEITDRISKANGPALLFEKVEVHSTPLLINAFGSNRRMAMALGVDDIEEIAAELEGLVQMPLPTGIVEKLKMIPKIARFAKYPLRACRRRHVRKFSPIRRRCHFCRFSNAGHRTAADS